MYATWFTQQPKEEYIEHCMNLYNAAIFIPEPVKNILWVGDSKPYFRQLLRWDYKGNRPTAPSDFSDFSAYADSLLKPLKYHHYEADDIIGAYVKSHPQERICILSVDSDLLQLCRKGDGEHNEVFWFCAYGYPPQKRSLCDGSFADWLTKKLSKSKRKLNHLDPNDPQSIVEWKVIMGDKSDGISAGEQSRVMIDINNPPAPWHLLETNPEATEDFESRKIACLPLRKGLNQYLAYGQFREHTGSNFPTQHEGYKPRSKITLKK